MTSSGVSGLLIGLVILCMAVPAAAGEPLSVRAVSPRAGLLFTDSEAVDVRVRVDGGKPPVEVSWRVQESAGPWKAEGTLALDAGATEKPLPLGLPGRGLYKLSIDVIAGQGRPAHNGSRATAQTWVAVVFTPPKPDPASPWGIFYTPHIWFNKANPNGARDAALSHRLLGASWSRLNFWAHSFEKVTVQDGKVTAEYPMWRSYARALRDEGISIMGEIAQCPRELSSRPDETSVAGDAGALWGRVKPRDYRLWDQLIENLARDFRDDIQVWEIWNEVNLRDRYWSGTPEELAELVEHTAAAFHRGNPKARVAGCGFVGDIGYADRLFQLGAGKHLDILSVHYTDASPDTIVGWRNLLARHNLDLPIWNSEERSEVPLRNMAGGIERSFKFIHVEIGYADYRPLVRKDLTVLPAGIAFSVGAHCIGAAKYLSRNGKVPGYDVFLFQRGDEVVGVFDRNQRTGVPQLFGPAATAVTLAAEPLPGREPTVTDIWGRSRPLDIQAGLATLPLGESIVFLNGCRRLEVREAAAREAGDALGFEALVFEALVFEAESGRFSKGWGDNPKAGFSCGRILEIWKKEPPDAEGYWAELKLRVPSDRLGRSAAGRYELLFSGNSLARLKPPASVSPFTWRIDDGEEHAVADAVPVIQGVPAAPEGLSLLGFVDLAAGDHTFRLRLTAPRTEPDNYYALWFDAIALRRK